MATLVTEGNGRLLLSPPTGRPGCCCPHLPSSRYSSWQFPIPLGTPTSEEFTTRAYSPGLRTLPVPTMASACFSPSSSLYLRHQMPSSWQDQESTGGGGSDMRVCVEKLRASSLQITQEALPSHHCPLLLPTVLPAGHSSGQTPLTCGQGLF